MFVDRGVGEHGVKLSSFCGPLILPVETVGPRSLLKFSFLTDEVHIQVSPKKNTVRMRYHTTHIPHGHAQSQVLIEWTEQATELFSV